MPAIKPLAEFNRNQTAIIGELKETQRPLYLTRNGTASIVVMDADAFDHAMSFREGIYADEMRVYGSLMKGYDDYLAGRVIDADEAEAQVMREKGWD